MSATSVLTGAGFALLVSVASVDAEVWEYGRDGDVLRAPVKHDTDNTYYAISSAPQAVSYTHLTLPTKA